jgi:dCTP deaminase
MSSDHFNDEEYKKYYGPLPDSMLTLLDKALPEDQKMIKPFISNQVREINGKKVISYGVSSYGYDIRVAQHFKIYSNINSQINDPKATTDKNFIELAGESVLIPPNSYALCRSVEEFDLPRDVTGIALGKSTYARSGIVCNITPLEAGWKGFLTIEIANCSQLPAKVYANEGICQIIFFKGIGCSTSYMDRAGKYQNQPASIILPRL